MDCETCMATMIDYPDGVTRCDDCRETDHIQLRERWDRAFFAALTGWASIAGAEDNTVVFHAAEIANETIRHHGGMMADRDAVIAEVVG